MPTERRAPIARCVMSLADALVHSPGLGCRGVHAGHSGHVLDVVAQLLADLEGGLAGIPRIQGHLAGELDHVVGRCRAAGLGELLHVLGRGLGGDREVLPRQAGVAVGTRPHLDQEVAVSDSSLCGVSTSKELTREPQ